MWQTRSPRLRSLSRAGLQGWPALLWPALLPASRLTAREIRARDLHPELRWTAFPASVVAGFDPRSTVKWNTVVYHAVNVRSKMRALLVDSSLLMCQTPLVLVSLLSIRCFLSIG